MTASHRFDLARVEQALRARGAEVEQILEGIRFTLRGTSGDLEGARGDDDEHWDLHCRVQLPAHAPAFELDLGPYDPVARERDEALDIVGAKLDDEAFERAFLVEAAPSDLIRSVLDARVRAELVALAPCRLRRELGMLHLAAGPIRDAAWVSRAAELCVSIVERLSWARDSLDVPRGGGPALAHEYRDVARLTRSDDDERNAAKEIETLRDARRLRRQLRGFPFGVGLIAALVTGMMLALWSPHC